jgi:hypothetical protein
MAAVIAELDKLRSIVQDAIAKVLGNFCHSSVHSYFYFHQNLYRTGILFGETLISSNECTISDIVLYAKVNLSSFLIFFSKI